MMVVLVGGNCKMIKQATGIDIPVIEDILLDVVQWMKEHGLENQWNATNVKWSQLSQNYSIDEFYVQYHDGVPVGCMALTDYDGRYWSQFSKGESIYLHKLAVRRSYAGGELSKEVIQFAKDFAQKQGVSALRLECNRKRMKLRELYEKEGFVLVQEIEIPQPGMALYEYKIAT